MLLLVAIEGQYPDDEFTCIPGELLRPAVCGRAEDCDTCGTRFAGISSEGVTTTAVLADVPITRRQLVDVIHGYAIEQWHWHGADLRGLAGDLRWPGRQHWPIGTILQRDHDQLTPRDQPATRP